jgi:hypothetical protein
MTTTNRTEGITTMITTSLPTRDGIRLEDRMTTTLALVTFFLMRGAKLHQVEALRIAYTTQDQAQALADEVLHNILAANPNTFGTYTMTWPQGI